MPRKVQPADDARTPRKVTKLNERQERFVLEYMTDYNRVRAYYAAGYTATSDENAASEACRLLKNPKVQAFVLNQKAIIAGRLGMKAERLALYFQVVYMEAMKVGDHASAVAALDRIAKHLGWYAADNKQKNGERMSEAERTKLKAELEAAGFNFDRVHFVAPEPKEN